VARRYKKSQEQLFGRRDFVKALAAVAPVAAGLAPAIAAAPRRESSAGIEEATISELARRMAAGETSALKITEAYLERIERLDRKGPALKSLIELNPDARRIAADLDRERREKGPRGPLHGIPVVLKDNIDTHDKMTTTAGSLALEGSIPAADSTVAARLRKAGAVLLAKANLSEWANFRSDYSSSGWSGRGGQCRNPYVVERNPCGSSSGSAVSVSANLCAVAVGTETNGSIVCPANANGVVGVKPTVGLVSRAGIIPIAHSFDTAGPMARTVTDAAILLEAMAGADSRDEATGAIPRELKVDYASHLDPAGMKGARIGVARGFAGFLPAVDALLDSAVQRIRQLGAEVIDPVKFPTRSEMGARSYEVMLYEFKADMNAYLAGLGAAAARVHTLSDLIRFNDDNKDREMPFFGQDVFISADAKGPLTSPEYLDALRQSRELSREKGIDEVMNEHKLDAIVAPTGGPASLTDLINGDHHLGGSSTPAAVAGYPNITVPMGFVRELPVGLSFFGRAWSEALLVRLAFAFEQATKARKPPRFLHEADLRS